MNVLRMAGSSRPFGTTAATLAGGKTKIKARKSRGRAKEHRMGGPSMQETFDLKNLDTYLGNDVPSWVHWRWDEARMRLKGLRLIAYQMPGLQRFREEFRPPPKGSVVRVQTQEELYEILGQHASLGTDHIVKATLRLGSVPSLASDPAAMHKCKVLAGEHWVPDRPGQAVAAKEMLAGDGTSEDGTGSAPDGHGEVRIECARYASRWQNEAWCSETLDRLVAEATDLSTETLADLPTPDEGRTKEARREEHRDVNGYPNHPFPVAWLAREAQEKVELGRREREDALGERRRALEKARLDGLAVWSDPPAPGLAEPSASA